MYKVIVAGSRDFDNYELLEEKLKIFLKGKKPSQVEIVSGTARGADRMGEWFAEKWSCKLTKFPANWDLHGKAAGYIRNEKMAKYSNGCILFWDGQSKGTMHMRNLAQQYNLDLYVVMYRQDS